MHQKQFATGTELPSPSDNISVPIGLVKTMEHYLGSAGILDFVDTFKEKGIPMSRIVVAMCTYVLMGNNSMKGCTKWLADPKVGKEMGLEKGLSQRTINRAVNIIGNHNDEMIVRLWKFLITFQPSLIDKPSEDCAIVSSNL